jgi:ADP-ribosylglycohydrolase
MDTGDPNLRSRFRGAILGAAVADALALPYQHYSRRFLQSFASPLTLAFAEHHSGFHPRGQYSDDTQTLLATIEAIVETGAVSGEAIAFRLASLARDNLFIDPDPSLIEALRRLESGPAAWQDAGLEPGRAEASPASRAVPIALWDSEDLEALGDDVALSTRITHRDARSMAAAAAAAAAIAVNSHTEELVLGEFLDRVAAPVARFDVGLGEAILDFPRVLSQREGRVLRHFESLFPDDRYLATGDGASEYAIPAVLMALYYFLKHPYSYERTVEGCLRVGGNIDTIALLGGAMSGALVGEEGIPEHLAANLHGAEQVARAADLLHERRGEPVGGKESA